MSDISTNDCRSRGKEVIVQHEQNMKRDRVRKVILIILVSVAIFVALWLALYIPASSLAEDESTVEESVNPFDSDSGGWYGNIYGTANVLSRTVKDPVTRKRFAHCRSLGDHNPDTGNLYASGSEDLGIGQNFSDRRHYQQQSFQSRKNIRAVAVCMIKVADSTSTISPR